MKCVSLAQVTTFAKQRQKHYEFKLKQMEKRQNEIRLKPARGVFANPKEVAAELFEKKQQAKSK